MSEQPVINQEAEKPQLPEHLQPDAYEHTLEGYLNLLEELQLTQRAVNLDFNQFMSNDRQALEQAAKPRIDAINAQRPEKPIDITAADGKFLLGLARPNWSEHYPTDPSDEEQRHRWDDFVEAMPKTMQTNLREMYFMHFKIDALGDDEALQKEFHEHRSEHISILKATAVWRIAERQKVKIGEDIAAIRAQAARSRRPLTPAEKRDIDSLSVYIKFYNDQRGSFLDSIEKKEKVIEELGLADNRDAKRQLESGLLMTKQMQDIIYEAMPALNRGEPMLLVGETGGAKTALAEYISRSHFQTEPEMVSGNGDANSYQLMGKQELREQEGATVSEFIEGPMIRAMEQGRPIILDEINAMPAELLKRFNKIMQLRPGDVFTIQEDSGREVTIKPGFCIIATMNEKSKRYKGVDDLSIEFQNRFGPNIYRVRYPDHDKGYADEPLENMRLAMAAVAEDSGELPAEIDQTDLYHFIKAARISQQIFSGSHGEGYSDFIDSSKVTDGKPGLEDTVLAPRTMVGILKKVAGSYGEITIDMALRRFVDGIKNPNDKKVMMQLLQGHNLLRTPAKKEFIDDDEWAPGEEE